MPETIREWLTHRLAVVSTPGEVRPIYYWRCDAHHKTEFGPKTYDPELARTNAKLHLRDHHQVDQ